MDYAGYDREVSRIAREFYEQNKELYKRKDYWYWERVYQEREIHRVFYNSDDIKKDENRPIDPRYV